MKSNKTTEQLLSEFLSKPENKIKKIEPVKVSHSPYTRYKMKHLFIDASDRREGIRDLRRKLKQRKQSLDGVVCET